jgi:predicted transcriptional regulator
MEDALKDRHNAHVATIAAAYLGNPSNPTDRDQIADVIRQIDVALKGPATPEATATVELEKPSAAAIRKSVTPEHLISFIDGRPYKTLKRHLLGHGHTVQSYRERYGLKADYPMTAPNYSAMRSGLAKARGLGQLQRGRAAPAASDAAPMPVGAETTPAAVSPAATAKPVKATSLGAGVAQAEPKAVRSTKTPKAFAAKAKPVAEAAAKAATPAPVSASKTVTTPKKVASKATAKNIAASSPVAAGTVATKTPAAAKMVQPKIVKGAAAPVAPKIKPAPGKRASKA